MYVKPSPTPTATLAPPSSCEKAGARAKRLAREAARRTRTPLDAAHLGHKVAGSSPGTSLPPSPIGGGPSTSGGRSTTGAWSMSATTRASTPRRALMASTCCVPSEPAEPSPRRHGAHLQGVGLDIRVRPIRHREERRVRAHLPARRLPGMAPAPRLGAAAVRRRDPGRRPTHPRPRRPGQAHRACPAQESIPAHRRRMAPSQPRYPARRTRDSLPQHLSSSRRPLGPGPVCAHRADTDSAPAPHTSSKRSQYRELPKAEIVDANQPVGICHTQGTSA